MSDGDLVPIFVVKKFLNIAAKQNTRAAGRLADLRDINAARESAITAAANMSISLKIWRANAPRRFSGRNTPMCSPIPARRPIWRSI